MSDAIPRHPSTSRYNSAWAASVARSRGLEIDQTEAATLAAFVAPILERFAELAGTLGEDEDMYDFRRLLAAEARDT